MSLNALSTSVGKQIINSPLKGGDKEMPLDSEDSRQTKMVDGNHGIVVTLKLIHTVVDFNSSRLTETVVPRHRFPEQVILYFSDDATVKVFNYCYSYSVWAATRPPL
jgi:hypothetical protein